MTKKRTLRQYFDLTMTTLISRFFRDKIRRGSIRAVKLYIQTVNVVRMSSMALFAAAMLGAVLVAGIVLVVVGIVGLLPIEPWAMAATVLGVGVLLTVVSAVIVSQIFSQKRWLEASNSYELMDAALGPFEGAFPPNPVELVTEAIHAPGGRRAQQARAHEHRKMDAELAFRTATAPAQGKSAEPVRAQRPEPRYEPRLSDLATSQLATPLVP